MGENGDESVVLIPVPPVDLVEVRAEISNPLSVYVLGQQRPENFSVRA